MRVGEVKPCFVRGWSLHFSKGDSLEPLYYERGES